ncbi:MAG TPA: PKD domain-containing protein [Chitinophagales bacterium]|nr:PKD domain-containing protein [Chitinophagales bacterium]
MKIFLAIVLMLCGHCVVAQNLVSNSDFETNSGVPTGVGQWANAIGWSNCNGGGSPDYFHVNGGFNVQLPNSFVGTVFPHSGNAVMGFCPYYNSQTVDYREYVSTAFTSAMVPGTTYAISFYETSGINTGSYCGQGIDKLSVALTVGSLTQSGTSPITSAIPQWTTPIIQYDTGWVQITFQITAADAYDHIAFGNFVNDAGTNAQTFVPTLFPGAYYFIDDIDVHLDSLPQINFIASDTSFCESTCIDFADQSNNNATAWQWSFPGGNPATSSLQNPTGICYSIPGAYDVTLITTGPGGNDTLTFPSYINVSSNPAAPVISASNDTLTSSAAGTYQWYFNGSIISGATDQTYVASQSGLYTVVVTNGSGCSASSDFLFSFLAFNATDTSLCEKFCIGFFDQSLNNPTSWLWIFPGGNPSTSTAQNPSNICYDVPGTYDVTLITTNANGTDTLTLLNYVTVHATPPFPTISQAGYTLTSSSATSYQWQLNSADISGATNQSYTIFQSGYYTVVVGDSNGCKNSSTLFILISGITDEMTEENILISPNPSDGHFIVELPNGPDLVGIADEISIDVVNMIGKKVFSSHQSPSFTTAANWKKEIDLHDAASGIYFIEIKTQNITLKKKILITK